MAQSRISTQVRRSLAGLGALTLAAGLAIAAAAPASAVTCGTDRSWSGLGDGTTWTQAANWSPEGVPTSTDIIDLTAVGGNPTSIVGAEGTVCSITVGANITLNTGTGAGLSVANSLDWNTTDAPGVIKGNVTVAGTSTFTSITTGKAPASLTFESSDGVTPAVLALGGLATVDAGTDLAVYDNLATIQETGGMSLGANTTVESSTAAAGVGGGTLQADGAVTLDGNVSSPQLNLDLGAAGGVNLVGHTWTISGGGWSRLTGAAVNSNVAGGIMLISQSAHALVDGTVTIGTGTTLAIDSATLSDGTWFNTAPGGIQGNPGTLTGAGTLELRSGTLSGAVTLDSGFHATATTTGSVQFDSGGYTPAPAMWVNHGTLLIKQGSLGSQGLGSALTNDGTFNICAGVTLTSGNVGSDLPLGFSNSVGATTHILSGSNVQCGNPADTQVHDYGWRFANDGTLTVDPNASLVLNSVADYDLDNGSTVNGGGTIITGESGTQLEVIGLVNVAGNTTITLDSGASLIGGDPTVAGTTGTLVGSGSGGTLSWLNGTLIGSLTTSGNLTSNVTTTANAIHATAANSSLTLNGTALINGALISLDPTTQVSIGAHVALANGGGFGHASTPTTGLITVMPAGNVQATQGAGIVDFPVTSRGALVASKSTSLDFGFGYTQTAGSTIIVSGGRVQAEAAGVGSHVGTVTVNAGTVLGAGTMQANLAQKGGTLETSSTHNGIGTLVVRGNYSLSGTATLYLRLQSASKHSIMKATGAASLKGRLTIVSTSYKAAVNTTIKSIVTGTSVSGNFTKTTNTGAAKHTAWKPVIVKKALNVVLAKA